MNQSQIAGKLYFCPMHPEVKSEKPDKCLKCGMDLVTKLSPENNESYLPLLTIVGLITAGALLVTFATTVRGTFSWEKTISSFMIGFFIIFSSFKLMDLKGFAQGYSMYDLLAKRVYAYGYIYPFIELFFGISMLFYPMNRTILWAELIVMTFSGLGVVNKLIKKEKFQCVCLGTFLKVPLTKVTLIEDFGMAILALILLLM